MLPTRRSGVFALALTFIATYAGAPQAQEDELAKLLKAPPLNAKAEALIFAQFRGEQADTALPPPADTKVALTEVLTEYQKQRDSLDTSTKLLSANSFGVETTVASLAALATPGVLEAVGLAAAGIATSRGLDYVQKEFEDAGKNSARQLLALRLEEIRKQTNDNSLSQFKGMSGDEIFARLYGPNHPLIDPKVTNVADEDLAVVNTFLIKSLRDVVATNELRSLKVDFSQQQDIRDTKRQLVALARTFTTYARENQQALSDIATRQQEINTAIAKMDDRIATNTEDTVRNSMDIAFLQTFMFGKMSPAEQRVALHNGFFNGMPEDQRKSLDDQLAILEKREALTTTVRTFLDSASHLRNIAHSMGVDPHFVGDVDKGIQLSSSAVNAFTTLSAGNYLAAADTVAALFGRGSSDIAAERHEQIVGMLTQLAAGQRRIMQMIDQLAEGQRQIIANQQKIYEAIQVLSRQVEANHEAVMSKLGQIHEDLLTNRALILSLARQNLKACSSFIETRKQFGYANGSFPDYAHLVAHYNSSKAFFAPCIAGLQTYFSTNGGFDPVFWTVSYEKDEHTVAARYRKDIYEPLWNAFQALRGRTDNEARRSFGCFLIPVRRTDDLWLKRDKIEEYKAEQSASLNQLMERPLSTDAIAEATAYLLDVHTYYQLLSETNTGAPLTVEQLADQKERSQVGRFLLTKALELIDFAIAQQTLVAGDIVLADIIDKLHPRYWDNYYRTRDHIRLSTFESEALRRAERTLNVDPIFAHNYIVMLLNDHLECLRLASGGFQCNHTLAELISHLERFRTDESTKIDPSRRESWDRNNKADQLELSKFREYWRWWNEEVGLRPDEFHYSEAADKANGIPSGWSYVFNDWESDSTGALTNHKSYLPLPSAAEIEMGSLYTSPELDDLLRLKSRVMDAIVCYTIPSKLSGDGQSLLFRSGLH